MSTDYLAQLDRVRELRKPRKPSATRIANTIFVRTEAEKYAPALLYDRVASGAHASLCISFPQQLKSRIHVKELELLRSFARLDLLDNDVDDRRILCSR